MIVAVAIIAGLAYWDAKREAGAALQDFAEEQLNLAGAAAAALRLALPDPPASAPAALPARIVEAVGGMERANRVVILFRAPGQPDFRTLAGHPVRLQPLRAAADGGQTMARLTRAEAAELGLPARTALAGVTTIRHAGQPWSFAAVGSAERERDRESWASRRLVLSVLAAGGLVLLFGGAAMRTQRNELTLERELAVAGIREQRDQRLERASKIAALGTLAVGVAHEISTPLSVIAGRAEQLLPRLAGDERASHGARAILEQTERISQVMRGLLGLARGDTPVAERLAPESVIRGAVALVEHRFSADEVALSVAVQPSLPGVLGDARLLEHALVNLLLNACYACRAQGGGGAVSLTGQREGATVLFSVIDNGSGIAAADAERAFEPFFTTKPRGEGTGLGLVLAQEIVASHRGSLHLEPAAPRGTRAVIRLPASDERPS
jgi:signal transduction histidine kinase